MTIESDGRPDQVAHSRSAELGDPNAGCDGAFADVLSTRLRAGRRRRSKSSMRPMRAPEPGCLRASSPFSGPHGPATDTTSDPAARVERVLRAFALGNLEQAATDPSLRLPTSDGSVVAIRVERSAEGLCVTLESSQRWVAALAGSIPGMLERLNTAGGRVLRIRTVVARQLVPRERQEHRR